MGRWATVATAVVLVAGGGPAAAGAGPAPSSPSAAVTSVGGGAVAGTAVAGWPTTCSARGTPLTTRHSFDPVVRCDLVALAAGRMLVVAGAAAGTGGLAGEAQFQVRVDATTVPSTDRLVDVGPATPTPHDRPMAVALVLDVAPGPHAIEVVAKTAHGAAVDVASSSIWALLLPTSSPSGLLCGDTGPDVVSPSGAPTLVGGCALDVPSRSRVVVVATATSSFDNLAYEGAMSVTVDGVDQASSTRTFDVGQGAAGGAGGDGLDATAALAWSGRLAPGDHALQVWAARSGGYGRVRLRDPQVAVLVVPDDAPALRACASSNDNHATTTSATFATMATCDVDLFDAGQVLELGGGSFVEQAIGVRGELEVAGDPGSDRTVDVFDNGTGGTDVAVLTMGVRAVAAGTTEVAATFRRLTLAGTVAVQHPFVIGIAVAQEPEDTDTAAFVALAPARILDTRPMPTLPPGSTTDVRVTGQGGVPSSGVSAVVLNVTATDAVAPGYVTLWPTGAPRPNASNLNIERRGQTIPNLVTVPVGDDGQVSVYVQSRLELVVDVLGYYRPALTAMAGRLVPVTPARAFDSRASGKLEPDSAAGIVIAGQAGVPGTGASAVVLNVTATEATDAGFVTVWPSGVERPTASNLNLLPGQTIANQVVVPLGPDGGIQLYTQSGTHLVVDVAGWFTDASAPERRSGLFVGLVPARLLDTRESTIVEPGGSVVVSGLLAGGLPPTPPAALALNVTATEASAPGYVTAYPSGHDLPLASNLNLERADQTIPNHATVALGDDGAFVLYSQAGTHLVVDVTGWYLR